jgi:aryl-alcohol dehydrogenase-like predicted oxidoreductase
MIWGQPRGWARWTPAQRAYGPSDGREEEEAAFEAALSAGVNLIDTAAMYANGASERRVGELARDRDVIIATKWPRTFSARARDLPAGLEESLANLGRPSIDLYQHHYPSGRIPIAELMERMADALEAGKIKAIGVSNYSAEQMRLAHATLARRGIALGSNQVMYSLAHRAPEVDGVMAACQELGVTLIAYSPLGMGSLTGKYSVRSKASGFRRLLPAFGRKAMEELHRCLRCSRKSGSAIRRRPARSPCAG